MATVVVETVVPRAIKKGTGKKASKSVDLVKQMPPVPTKPLPKIDDKNANILKSKIKAFESEILSLQADNALLKQDVDDCNEKIRKLKEQIEVEQNLTTTFKTEAQTLKLSLAEDTKRHDKLKKQHEETMVELSAVNKKFSEISILVEGAKKIKENHEKTVSTMTNDFTEKINNTQREHAKELGRLKNLYEEKIEELHKSCAQTERVCEKEMKMLKEEKLKTELELKDTAVGLANRCQAYERRIDIQEQEISRLNMSLQLKTKPNTYKVEQNEKTITELKEMNEIQSKQIADMMGKLNLINLNKHYDFRDNKWFT